MGLWVYGSENGSYLKIKRKNTARVKQEVTFVGRRCEPVEFLTTLYRLSSQVLCYMLI